MLRLIVFLTAGAVAAAGCAPALAVRRPTVNQPRWHWDNVVALPTGAAVRVFAADGQRHEGSFVHADDVLLTLNTMDGHVVLDAAIVQRVDRLAALPTRSRRRRALVAATVGTVAAVGVTSLAMALVCTAMGGRPCWVPPRPKAVAITAAVFGGLGALSDDSRPITIYARP